MDSVEQALGAHLKLDYGCHTIILCGSRAQGMARPDSDWDVVALNDAPHRQWCHKQIEGVGEVNAYIYPADMGPYVEASPSALYRPLNFFVRLRHGKVLLDRDGLGAQIIATAKALFDKGAGIPSAEYLANQRHYYFDYGLRNLADPSMPTMMKQYIQHELIFQALPSYFWLRGMWPPAPKDAFSYLKKNKYQIYDAFEYAMKPEATRADLEALFNLVLARN